MRRALLILALWPGLALGALAIEAGFPVVASHAYDGSQPTTQDVTVTTAGASLLCALAASHSAGGGAGAVTTSVAGGGLAWTKYAERTGEGAAATWCAYSAGALSSQTITVTWAGGQFRTFASVLSFTGASGSIGGTNTANLTTGAPGISVTATAAGSYVIGSAAIIDGSGSLAMDGSTTQAGLLNDGGGSRLFFGMRSTSTTGGAGAVAIGATAPILGPAAAYIQAVEVLEGGGGGPPPGPVHSGMAGFWGMLLLPSGGEQYE